MKDVKARLYRLQQRLAISRGESLVILVVLGLFGVGLVAQHLWTPRPVEGVTYEASSAPAERGMMKPLPAPNRSGRPASDAPAPDSAPARVSQVVLNLNAATPAELEQLPGIGPVLAERIEQYRLQHGSFQRVEDITRVHGIGAKTLDNLKPLLVVRVTPDSAQRP